MNQTIAPGIELDPEHDLLTIDGIRYARSLFRVMASAEIDPRKAFQIIKRDDGVVTLRQLSLPYGGVTLWG